MPFYLQNPAIGFNCILLVIYLLDFVILPFTTQSDSINFISLLEKRDMKIYGQNFAVSSYSVLGTDDAQILFNKAHLVALWLWCFL